MALHQGYMEVMEVRRGRKNEAANRHVKMVGKRVFKREREEASPR